MYKRAPRVVFIAGNPLLAQRAAALLKKQAAGLAQGRALVSAINDSDNSASQEGLSDWQEAIDWADVLICLDEQSHSLMTEWSCGKVRKTWQLDQHCALINAACIEALTRHIDGLLGGIRLLER